jgi:transcription elongation factor Elf1
MADGTPERDKSDDSVDEYVFTCPACGQEISVNNEMKSAILSNGCPVCASSVGEGCFDG